jgi:PAS domain S-box-containing protein
MYSEEVRRKAMVAARDSDIAALSGKVTLVQETGEDVQAGALMFVPVYNMKMPFGNTEQRRAAIKGWVYSPIRMDDLMKDLLEPFDIISKGNISLKIYDGDTISDESLLFVSKKNHNPESADSRNYEVHVDYHGKRWTLCFLQNKVPESLLRQKSATILLSGIIISILLSALAFTLLNTRQRALSIARELTSELRASQERFQTILNSAAEGIYGIDNSGNCTFANTSCINILGYNDQESLLGRNMHNLIHHTKSNGTPCIFEDCIFSKILKEGSGIHNEDYLWKADGKRFPAELWSHSVIVNDKTEGAVVTFVDITERREAEKIINKAKLDAEIANKAKSDFLLSIGHEFRTPLNAVIGYAELLESYEGTIRKEYTESIKASGRRLLDMINNLIELIRAEKAEIVLTYDNLDTSVFFAEITRNLSALAREKELEFRTEIAENVPLIISGDSEKLKLVVINLVENAIKYTDKGEVVLKVFAANTDSIKHKTDLVIQVSDTGKGISEEFQKDLYKAFTQEGKKTIMSGIGIGLTLINHFVNAMNGTISVKSIPGEGSTFKVELKRIEYKGSEKNVKTVSEIRHDETETDKIDTNEITDLPGLIAELEGRMAARYRSLEGRQPLAEVKRFGQELMKLGNKHTCSSLSDYGNQLSDAADNFDIEGMLKLIKSYQSKIEALKT